MRKIGRCFDKYGRGQYIAAAFLGLGLMSYVGTGDQFPSYESSALVDLAIFAMLVGAVALLVGADRIRIRFGRPCSRLARVAALGLSVLLVGVVMAEYNKANLTPSAQELDAQFEAELSAEMERAREASSDWTRERPYDDSQEPIVKEPMFPDSPPPANHEVVPPPVRELEKGYRVEPPVRFPQDLLPTQI